MIKCEVVFDGAKIKVGDFTISVDQGRFAVFGVFKRGEFIKRYSEIEQAIKYCMEN